MRIKHIKLNCANLEEQKHFYTKEFRFKIVEEGLDEICLQTGNSLLTFSENKLKKPYYHFAFNIPYRAMEKALKWLKNKVEVIETGDGKIQDFASWNAKSIYFLDPAGNVVEFIGRQRFHNDDTGSFNESAILNISEIGLPVSDVAGAFQRLQKTTGIAEFDCDNSKFCACGDDEGLFILVDKVGKTWFPTDEDAKVFPLEVNFETSDEQEYNLITANGDFEITKPGKGKWKRQIRQ